MRLHLVLGFAGMLTAAGAAAQPADETTGSAGGTPAGAAGETEMSDADKLAPGLAEKAEADGVVRVIVEVQPSDPAELAAGGSLRGYCENADCARLQVQQGLGAEEAPLVEWLGEDALMVMEVTAQGLEALQASPFVVRVEPDALARPGPGEVENGSPGGAGDHGELDAPQ